MLAALWVATVCSLLTASSARSFLGFCSFRLLTGVGLGALLPVSVAYLNEFAPHRLAQRFATWGWGLGFSAGGVAASVVGVFLTPSLGWPILYYVASLSGVLAAVCHWALPESPQFLAVRGRTEGIADILARLNKAAAGRYRSPGVTFMMPEPGQSAGSLRLLLSARYRRTTIAVWSAAFCVLFSIYGLTGWVPTAMMQRGESFAASFAFGALVLAMNFFGTLACGTVIDRVGRAKWAMAGWWTAGALSVAVLGFVDAHGVNIASLAAAGFFVLGGQGALNNTTAAWYETEVRGTALGWMLGIGRLGGILGPVFTGWIQEAYPGAHALFVAIALAALGGAVAISQAGPHRVQASAGIEDEP